MAMAMIFLKARTSINSTGEFGHISGFLARPECRLTPGLLRWLKVAAVATLPNGRLGRLSPHGAAW
jgi:hypothetical protein